MATGDNKRDYPEKSDRGRDVAKNCQSTGGVVKLREIHCRQYHSVSRIH